MGSIASYFLLWAFAASLGKFSDCKGSQDSSIVSLPDIDEENDEFSLAVLTPDYESALSYSPRRGYAATLPRRIANGDTFNGDVFSSSPHRRQWYDRPKDGEREKIHHHDHHQTNNKHSHHHTNQQHSEHHANHHQSHHHTNHQHSHHQSKHHHNHHQPNNHPNHHNPVLFFNLKTRRNQTDRHNTKNQSFHNLNHNNLQTDRHNTKHHNLNHQNLQTDRNNTKHHNLNHQNLQTDRNNTNHNLNQQNLNSQPYNQNQGNEKHEKFSSKRSKKMRRHEKSNLFHTSHRHYPQEAPAEKEPSFDKSSPSVVTAQLGSPAFLSCRIHDLQDKSVSWIRNSDAHILTIDRYTFIADSRFVSWYDSDSETWTLQVKFTRPDDAGRYECQVSTEPKRSHFVTLSVIVPKVVIPGGSELHVRSGSDVLLKCVISRALSVPPHVFWYHEEARVPEHSRAGGLVHQALLQKVSDDSSVASLSIKSVKGHHAGNYTCAPAGLAASASVLLHVLNGEHPAAMQHGSKGSSGPRVAAVLPTYLLCVIVFFRLKFCCGS